MKAYLDVEQGSHDWLMLRLGIPTSSCFEKIVTPTGKLSAQARQYAIYLITEKLLNRSLESLPTLEWVGRGKELEPTAAKMYEFENEVSTKKVGFITTDDGRIGCSPDRLIPSLNAGLEIKCPAPWTHMGYLIDGFGKDYVPQVQGQLYVAEFDFVDRYSFHPDMPPVLVRTYRDEAYIKTLAAALDEFCDMKDGLLEMVSRKGLFAERTRLLTPREEDVIERNLPEVPDDPLMEVVGF